MRIAEVSAEYSISADTLRYYERIGLLGRIRRDPRGVRDYSEADCERIKFVKCMRGAGVPIEPLIEYMRLFDKGDATLAQRKAILEQQRDVMAQNIQAMQEGLDRLNAKIDNYDTLIVEAERRMRGQAETPSRTPSARGAGRR